MPRNERGSIAVIAAISFPLFLLLAAMVIDVGNWYTHKRSLQNRADAAALAAGYQYLSVLQSCLADSTDTGPGSLALTDIAKQYAGAVSGDFNSENVNNQSRVSVGVNSNNTDPFVDYSDGANPCKQHLVGDTYSPAKSLWTDVKVRETDIGTLAGGFGLNLSSVTAQARVNVNQLIGVRKGGLPFVNETGDQVDCAWAQFVDVTDSDKQVSLKPAGTPNPVPLTRDPKNPRRWTAPVAGIDLGPTGTDDIGVRYWMGTSDGGCAYDPTASDAKTGVSPSASATPTPWLDHINVWDDDSPKSDGPPLLHDFELTGNTCGGPGYLYTTSIDANTTCTVDFTLTVDAGTGNPVPHEIIVSSSNANVAAVSVGGSGTGGATYTGTLTFKPNEVVDPVSPTYLQDYTQVGLHLLKVSWRRISGTVDGKKCTSGKPCTGVFENGASTGCSKGCLDETWAHSTYVADPARSSPIADAELVDAGGTPIANSYAADDPDGVGAFTVDLRTYGVDQQRTFLIRDSVQNTGNRSKAIDCGQNSPNEPGLADAIVNGCKDPVKINTRNDVCTTPWPGGVRDCVETVPGTKQATAKAYMDRFSCSDQNNWVAGSSPGNLSDSDPRYAYIFLTSWGRISNAKSQGEELPIRAFLRVYVTGWDKMGGGKPGPETCAGNEPPPIQYDDGSPSGAVLWGHFVDVITLSDDVIVGDEPCDTEADVVTCKPQLVR